MRIMIVNMVSVRAGNRAGARNNQMQRTALDLFLALPSRLPAPIMYSKFKRKTRGLYHYTTKGVGCKKSEKQCESGDSRVKDKK